MPNSVLSCLSFRAMLGRSVYWIRMIRVKLISCIAMHKVAGTRNHTNHE